MKRRMVLMAGIVLAGAAVSYGFLFSSSTGEIKSDTAGVTINLEGPWWSKAKVGPEAKEIELKTGVYKPKQIQRILTRESKNEGTEKVVKENWRLYSYGPWGTLAKITVEKDKTTVLKFGGPVTFKIDTLPVKTAASDPDHRQLISIGLKIVGEYGEEYNQRVTRYVTGAKSGSVDAPALSIVDESGKEVASGKFAFG